MRKKAYGKIFVSLFFSEDWICRNVWGKRILASVLTGEDVIHNAGHALIERSSMQAGGNVFNFFDVFLRNVGT